MKRSLKIAAAALGVAGAGACHATTYQVKAIDSGLSATCAGINARGDAVGSAKAGFHAEFDMQAFVATKQRLVTYGLHDGHQAAEAYGINAGRTVVGDIIFDQIFGFIEPAAWGPDRTVHVLPSLSPFNPGGGALGVNDAGEIVGYSVTADNRRHATLWRGGVAIDLTPAAADSVAFAINASGQVAGIADDMAVLAAAGVLTPLGTLGGRQSAAHGINAAGHVVGESALAGHHGEHAFLYANGRMRDLDAGWSGSSAASAVNASDVVVGHRDPSHGEDSLGMIWRDGEAIPLDDVIDPVSGAGWHFFSGDAINDAGQICASGAHGDAQTQAAALLTPMD